VAVVRTDVSEELIASVIRAKRISEPGTTITFSYLADSFYSNDEGNTFLRNVGCYKPHSATSQKTAFLLSVHVQL
jgi:hypothetical protein